MTDKNLSSVFMDWLKQEKEKNPNITLEEAHEAWMKVYQRKCGFKENDNKEGIISLLAARLSMVTDEFGEEAFRTQYGQFLKFLLQQFPEYGEGGDKK